MEYILGLSYGYHDSSAVLLGDDSILAASEEERFTRIKHDNSFPKNAISYALNQCSIRPEDINKIVIYEDPIVKLIRQSTSTVESTIRLDFRNLRKLIRNLWKVDYSTKDVAISFYKNGLIKNKEIK